MVAAYKVSLIEELAARLLVNVPSAILANLVLGENVVPEFLQRDCTADRLAEALVPLLGDTPERRRQIEAFARLDAIMEIGKGSPERPSGGDGARYCRPDNRVRTCESGFGAASGMTCCTVPDRRMSLYETGFQP